MDRSKTSTDLNSQIQFCRGSHGSGNPRRTHLGRMGILRLRDSFLRVACPFFVLIFVFAFNLPLKAQIRIGGGIAFGRGLTEDDNQTSDVESGGVLQTNPDLESILQQAERIRDDGNYRVAAQLWDAVLKQSGDSLYSSDGSTYYSLVEQVEGILATLPPEGLAVYRVLADAEAKEIMAQANGPNDIEALNEVVRQYFVSSLGDEAAFKLGCIYLDRYDFIGARRMFEKIATQYPEPSIPMEELYTRIALCQSFLGDVKLARVSLEKAEEFSANTPKATLVRESLGTLSVGENTSRIELNYTNPMGNEKRYGAMPPIPPEMMKQDLAAIWQFYFEPKTQYRKAVDVAGAILTGSSASGDSVKNTMSVEERRVVKAWRDKNWRPAGHLLFEDDRVYFKTGADVSVWNRNKILKAAKNDAAETKLDSAIQWRSVWHNIFEQDEATRMMELIQQNMGVVRRGSNGTTVSTGAIPAGPLQVQLFGDKIYQQMSIHNKNFYSIEGKSFSDTHKKIVSNAQPQWNATVRRSRQNHLTCYDSETGLVQWTLPREIEDDKDGDLTLEEDEPEWLASGGFMSAPIGYGEIILVPVNAGGAISLYALDPKQEGKTIWKSFLCDEPETGAVPWSAIDLSIDGSDLFVSCGMGVVFVVDPASGTIRFAKRYSRNGKAKPSPVRNGWMPNRMEFDGWSNDVIIPYGRQMICFSSDSDEIEAFDRNSGKTIWRSEMTPLGFKVDYLLGVYNDMLYAAGSETIVAYDLKGEGRMIWGADQAFDGKQSHGRGMLTPSGIYMPVEDSIYQFDLQGKGGKAKLVAKVHVDLGTGAPVGNLYSDGERFWVHGANRIYALGPAPNSPKDKKDEDAEDKVSDNRSPKSLDVMTVFSDERDWLTPNRVPAIPVSNPVPIKIKR